MFPWDNLISGAAGVAGGSIVTSLQAHYPGRRDKQDRRRTAYTEMILRLDDLRRLFGARKTLKLETLDPSTDTGRTVGEITGRMVGEIQRAHIAVLLTGSKAAQGKADPAWQLAWDINSLLGGGPSRDAVARLGDLLRGFQDASREFGDTVRRELA